MKPMRFNVGGGKFWTAKREPKIAQLRSGLKPRYLSGWMLTTDDGVERFSPGNWIQFVQFARLIASNYGVEIRIS